MIARFSEVLIYGNNLVFTIEIIFSKNIVLFFFEFMEQVLVTVMKPIIISYIPHYIQKFLRIKEFAQIRGIKKNVIFIFMFFIYIINLPLS